jgi:ParB family transcriptional regulator, chromosome partitioning protein
MTTKPSVPEPFWIGDGGKLMLKLDDIIIGERHRQDLGDIAKMAKSIEDVGQLQPIVVTVKRELIGGFRRIEALRLLGMDAEVTIAVNVDDALSKLKAERDENECRKEFTRAEANAVGKAIKVLLAAEADERKKATQFGTEGGGDESSQPVTEKGRTAEKVAEVTGISKTVQREMDYVENTAHWMRTNCPIM